MYRFSINETESLATFMTVHSKRSNYYEMMNRILVSSISLNFDKTQTKININIAYHQNIGVDGNNIYSNASNYVEMLHKNYTQ